MKIFSNLIGPVREVGVMTSAPAGYCRDLDVFAAVFGLLAVPTGHSGIPYCATGVNNMYTKSLSFAIYSVTGYRVFCDFIKN